MTNPLLADYELPPLRSIRPEHVEPAVREIITANRDRFNALLRGGIVSWNTVVVPIEEMQHRLARVWSPIGHLNSVLNSEELRTAYNACLPLLTAWYTELA